MKQIVSMLLALAFLFGMAACGQAASETNSAASSETVLETLPTLADAGAAFTGEPNPGNFNLETRTVMLNSGYAMPIMGLGTYSLSDEEC